MIHKDKQFKSDTVCRFSVGWHLAQKLVRRTELSATTKLSSEDETPPIATVLLDKPHASMTLK